MHPNLIKLLINNRGRGLFRAEKSVSDEATVYVYDVIVSDDYWGGITPLAFAKELANIDAPVVHLRINSPGGDVFAARAMQQAMRDHGARFIAHIDGIAASAATFLPMAATESIIAPGGVFMIHNAWAIAMGNAKEFTDMAGLLSKIDDSIASEYVKKTGHDLSKITDWMNAETYFMDQEAVDNGFIDKIAESGAKNQINWDLSAYLNAPVENNQKPPESDKKVDEIVNNHAKNRPKRREIISFASP